MSDQRNRRPLSGNFAFSIQFLMDLSDGNCFAIGFRANNNPESIRSRQFLGRSDDSIFCHTFFLRDIRASPSFSRATLVAHLDHFRNVLFLTRTIAPSNSFFEVKLPYMTLHPVKIKVNGKTEWKKKVNLSYPLISVRV